MLTIPDSAESLAVGHRRARWAIIGLTANAVLAIAAVIVSALDIWRLTSLASRGNIPDIDTALEDTLLFTIWLVQAAIGILQVLALIFTVVLFLLWIHRAYGNLLLLGVQKQDLKYSPGWAVGWFFIPIANLVMPFLVVSEIWKASSPNLNPLDSASWKARRTPRLLFIWWAFWIVSVLLGQVAARLIMASETIESNITSAWVTLVSDLGTAIAAVLAALIVRGIDRRQKRATY